MSTQIPTMSCNQAPAELGDGCPEGMPLEAGVCQCELQGLSLEAGFSSTVPHASPDLRATPLRPGDRRTPPHTHHIHAEPALAEGSGLGKGGSV